MDSSGTIHKRIYQACDNCRTKRVRCHLGSVDQPQDPPCARCKRENRECIFSSTRNKRAKVTHGDPIRNPLDEVERTDPDASIHYYASPLSGDGHQTESSDGKQTVSTLLDRQVYTSHDALEVLHEASQHSGTPVVNTPLSSSRKESRHRNKNEASRNDNVLKIWNSLRFVQTGLFTAEEALSYVTYFYIHLSPLSPVPTIRFKNPSQHMKLLEEESVLALTILMLASRYMTLSGQGAVTRGNIIHDRLWNYLRGMITKVFWSEESFMSDDTTNPESTQRSVLRTIGTCEALLLLLLEWHPKTLHFPSVDNDTDSIIVRNWNEVRTAHTTEGRYGRNRSGVDWLSRSDRICWSLLGLAQILAVELGLFEKQVKSKEDNERAHRIQQLLWVFSIQTSGRLGWKYPPTVQTTRQYTLTSLDDSTSCWVGIASLLQKGHELLFSTPKQIDDLVSKREYGPLLRILLALLEDWQRDFQSANYTSAPSELKPSFSRDRRADENVVSKSMRWILAIEYEYVRVYVYSIVLQAVIECQRKEKASPGDQIARGESQHEDTDVLYDGLYLGYLTDAARSLLRVVVDEIFPDGCLLNIPVQAYSRILTAALYLLKTCAIEVKDREVQKSVELVIRTARALQSSVVDDVHLSTHWGNLLISLCSSLSARATTTATPRFDLGMQQRNPPNNETVGNNQTIPQSGFEPQRNSSGSPLQSMSPPPVQSGMLNPAPYNPPYFYGITIPPAFGPDQSTDYDNMFSWTDPMGGMPITQMPWNGDQAIFDILASVMGSENQ